MYRKWSNFEGNNFNRLLDRLSWMLVFDHFVKACISKVSENYLNQAQGYVNLTENYKLLIKDC